MFRMPAIVIGVVGAAFLAGQNVPGILVFSSPAQSQGRAGTAIDRQQTHSASKGDRLASATATGGKTSVSVVELVGVSLATVILRDRQGNVLYRSDPQAGTTTYAKNTELPIVTLKEDMQSPAAVHPVRQQEGREEPGNVQQKKRRQPVGCLGDVSSLVHSSADRASSLCLALLDTARP